MLGRTVALARATAARRAFSTVPSEADVVVIGGGSIGASTLYHLAERGINAVMVEKDQLTAGTTWHSAGLLWRLRPADTDIELIDHTRHLARNVLEQETSLSPGWIENGGLFIASNERRLDEYKRLQTLGKAYGIESHVCTPEEAQKIHPLMSTEDMYGALYSPNDGTIDPSGWVSALTKGAKMRGAKIFENCRVTAVDTEATTSTGTPKVTGVATSQGYIKTNTVVDCAGVWGANLGSLVGVDVPLVGMRHAYIVMDKVPGIQGLPNIRDHDLSVYLKLQGDSLAIGGYEVDPVFWTPEPDFAFGLFEMDLMEEFGAHLENHFKRVPVLEECGVKSTVCGPESFTPDHKPIIGEAPEVSGFFINAGFNSAGIMLSGGAGRELATWIDEGRSTMDMFHYAPTRFAPEATRNPEWVNAKSHEAYVKNYAVVYPHDQPLAGRNLRTDALHSTLAEQGCVYEEKLGWERPGWFLEVAELEGNPTALPKEYDYYGGYLQSYHDHDHPLARPLNDDHLYHRLVDGECNFTWPASHEKVGKEVDACRNRVAVFNQSYFGKFFVSGLDAEAAMDWISTAAIAGRPVGDTVYTAMCNHRGGVECDLTVSRIEDDLATGAKQYYVAAGGGSAAHDLDWIRRSAEVGGFDITVTDRTAEFGLLNVQGPKARELLMAVVDVPEQVEQLGFSKNMLIKVAGHEVRAIRLTFMGEYGFELHTPADSLVDVYRALMKEGAQFGIENSGYRAIDVLSAEKGYRHWSEDVRADDSALEAGYAFVMKGFTKATKDNSAPFQGREALEAQKAAGLTRRLQCFTVDPSVPLHGSEVILRDGEVVGYLRRAAFGHSINRSIGFGYVSHPEGGVVSVDYLKSADSWEIEVMGVRYPAKREPKAVFDPKNDRIKGDYSALEAAA